MNYYQLPPEIKKAITDSLPVVAGNNDMTAHDLVEAVNTILRANYSAPFLETPPLTGTMTHGTRTTD